MDCDHAESASPFGKLPQELLDNVISYLNPPAPSLSRVQDEPSYDITTGPRILKAASMVCKRWRRASIPSLFKNSRFFVDNLDCLIGKQASRYFEFLEKYNLEHIVQSFVFCVKHSPVVPIPSDTHTSAPQLSSFWSMLFRIINPSDFILVARPEHLGLLIGYDATSDDAWMFKMDYHLLYLHCPATEPRVGRPVDRGRYLTSNLLHQKPWTSLLLNEGSFIDVFHQYEYFHRRPASVIQGLLGGYRITSGGASRLLETLIPPSITELSYVALFPVFTHFASLITKLPRLDKLYVQITPKPDNDILKNKELMQSLDSRDLWMERNHCYTGIMRQLFDHSEVGNFRHLKVFESGDATDVDAWNMAVQFVESQGGWAIERPGVFVKKPEGSGQDNEAAQTSTALSVS